MCAVIPVMLAGSMDLVAIGDRQAGFFELVCFPRSRYVRDLRGVLHLCDGECEPGPVRFGRGRKRTRRRISHGILGTALELLLHGRVRLDARRQPARIDPVPRWLAWSVAGRAMLGLTFEHGFW